MLVCQVVRPSNNRLESNRDSAAWGTAYARDARRRGKLDYKHDRGAGHGTKRVTEDDCIKTRIIGTSRRKGQCGIGCAGDSYAVVQPMKDQRLSAECLDAQDHVVSRRHDLV